jgi:zinc/manganese transport system substrate-binding protein
MSARRIPAALAGAVAAAATALALTGCATAGSP